MHNCINKNTGKPLSVFKNIKDAWSCARYEKQVRKLDLYPYKCDRCGYYHLAPTSSRIRLLKNGCHCLNSSKTDGKYLYENYSDAERARDKIYKEKGIYLKIYECPETYGYHLTHHW